MLEGLDDIDWKKVKGNSFGKGPEVAEHLERLTEPDSEQTDLSIMLVDDGRIAPSAEVALPFLLDLLEHPEANRREVLEILEALLSPDVHPWDTVGLDPAEPLGRTVVRKKRFRVIYESLEASLPRVLACLADDRAETRRAAARLACWFGRQSSGIVPAVLERLDLEQDRDTRTELLLCCGYHRAYLLNDRARKRDRSAEPQLTQALTSRLSGEHAGPAATALAIAPGPVPEQAFAVLSAVVTRRHTVDTSLDIRPRTREHAWEFLARRLFLCLPPPQRSNVVDVLTGLYATSWGRAAEALARDAVLVAFGALPSDRPAGPAYELEATSDLEALTELQQRVLRLVSSRPGPFGRVLRERLGFLGLPTDRQALARHVGGEASPDPDAETLAADPALLRDYAGFEVRPDLNLNRVRIEAVTRLAEHGAEDIEDDDLHSLLAQLFPMRTATDSLRARRDEGLAGLLDALPEARRAQAGAFLREQCGWARG